MLVALSAAFGTHGSQIGQQLARRLGVPVYDHALASLIAEKLDTEAEAVLAFERGEDPRLSRRVAQCFALAAGDVTGMPSTPGFLVSDLWAAMHAAIREQAMSGAGVIVNPWACATLRHHPRALLVRLTGPPPARVQQATRFGEFPIKTTQQAQRLSDRRQADLLRRFCNANINSPDQYHITLDTTSLSIAGCVDVIAHAAEAGEDSAGHGFPSNFTA